MVSGWATVAMVAAGVNLVLLATLGAIWGRNYLELRSSYAGGLLTFAALLFAENAVALYYYVLDPTLSVWFSTAVPPIAWQAMLSLHVLETVALAVLTRMTVR